MDTFTMLLYGLVPLLAFAIADSFGNPKIGILLAVLLSLCEVIWMYVQFDRLDPVSVTAFLLIIGLGFVTLRRRNAVFFKYQPVVVGVFTAGFIAYIQLVGPTVMERYGDGMAALMAPEQAQMLRDPVFIAYMDRIFLGAIPAILLHAAWVAWAASRQSTRAWILTRAFGFWVVVIPTVFIVAAIFPP